MKEPKPLLTRSDTTTKREFTSPPMPTYTEPPWEPYHSQDKQDDDRGQVDHVTLEDT
jgi:hypothetical protein